MGDVSAADSPKAKFTPFVEVKFSKCNKGPKGCEDAECSAKLVNGMYKRLEKSDEDDEPGSVRYYRVIKVDQKIHSYQSTSGSRVELVLSESKRQESTRAGC